MGDISYIVVKLKSLVDKIHLVLLQHNAVADSNDSNSKSKKRCNSEYKGKDSKLYFFDVQPCLQ